MEPFDWTEKFELAQGEHSSGRVQSRASVTGGCDRPGLTTSNKKLLGWNYSS